MLDVIGPIDSPLYLVPKAKFVQSDVYGDDVRGDRFGEVLMLPRAMPRLPWK